MRLDELPRETLLQIFDYVSTTDLWLNVRCACKTFNAILLRNAYWLQRAQVYYGVHLPSRLKEHEDALSFDEAKRCRATERAANKWAALDSLADPKIAQVHYATVDAVKLFCIGGTKKRMCFTAARDRSIVLWDMDAIRKDKDENSWVSSRVDAAHEGWIWQLCMKGDSELYSAGWDKYLKQWLLSESSLMAGAQLMMDTAVLSCLSDGSNLIYTSTYNAGPIMCDTRAGLNVLHTLKCHHSKSVFSMATGEDTNYIYSVGEDNNLMAVDKRKFTQPVRSWKNSCNSGSISRLHYSAGYLGISFRNGLLLFMNPESLEIENKLWVESNSPIKPTTSSTNHFCMSLSTGAICCAYGSELKVYTPGLTPKLLSDTDMSVIITQVDCQEDYLAVGTGTGSVCFWQ